MTDAQYLKLFILLGGTNFGFMNGANGLVPVTTSYGTVK